MSREMARVVYYYVKCEHGIVHCFSFGLDCFCTVASFGLECFACVSDLLLYFVFLSYAKSLHLFIYHKYSQII